MAARARADFGCTTTVVGLGNQFDPDVLDAFFRRREDVLAVRIDHADVDDV